MPQGDLWRWEVTTREGSLRRSSCALQRMALATESLLLRATKGCFARGVPLPLGSAPPHLTFAGVILVGEGIAELPSGGDEVGGEEPEVAVRRRPKVDLPSKTNLR
jgi:hypothetical protein